MRRATPVGLAAAVALLGLIALLATVAGSVPDRDLQPSFPIRAAFYYPWYPETWGNSPSGPYTVYTPTAGYYDSSDLDVIRRHVDAMEYAGIDAGILSWWGRGKATDNRVPAILAASAGTSFRWAIYHERESLGDPGPAEIREDLAYLRDRYGSDPSFLRVGGRFVVFVYADANDRCAMVERWSAANVGVDAYLVLKVFPRYRSCPQQPDGWHQYAPANPVDRQGGHSFTISPGFHKKDEVERLPRDPELWRENIRQMVASGAAFQLITSFNEWGEGTAIEPAVQWASPSGYGLYLDALRNDGAEPGQAGQ